MDVSPSHGIVKVNQIAPSSYPFEYTFDSDTEVSLEAVPAFGYAFKGWSGDLSDATNPTTLKMDCDKSITADFSFNWSLAGSVIGSLVLAGLLVAVLIIRR